MQRVKKLFGLFLAVCAMTWMPAGALTTKDFSKDMKLLKKANAIAVPGYRVYFVVRDGTWAEGRAGQGARADMAVELDGVNTELLQKITDQGYADLMERLAKTGRPIVTPDDMKAAKGWSDIKAEPTPYFKRAGNTIAAYSPATLPLWFIHGDLPYGNVGVATLGPWRTLNQLSAATKSVLVVPQITVHFAEMETSGRSSGGGASVGAKPGLYAVSSHTGVKLYQAKMKLAGDLGFANLQKDLKFDAIPMETIKISESSNQEQMSFNAAVGAAVGRVESKSIHAIKVNPAEYEAAVLKGIKEINEAIAQAAIEYK